LSLYPKRYVKMIPPKNPIAITTAAIFPIIATNAGIVRTQVEINAVCIPPDVAINTPPIASKRHTITNGLDNLVVMRVH
jgi:hypothetical protein